MSMDGVANNLIKAMSNEEKHYAFVMCNLAPPDMVGHTGKYEPAIAAVEATDAIIGRIKQACEKHGYVLVITADHGNVEEMLDEHGNPKTSHTTNPVFLLISGLKSARFAHTQGGLSDVAPTILHIMGLPIPKEMEGRNMLK